MIKSPVYKDSFLFHFLNYILFISSSFIALAKSGSATLNKSGENNIFASFKEKSLRLLP